MKSRPLVLTPRDLLVFIFASYAIVISVFLGDDLRNYLVIFAALLGGLLFFALRLTLQPLDFWTFLLFLIMITTGFYIGGADSLGSVALTFVYALGYFAIASLFEQIDDKRAFAQTMLRGIIFAFAAVSLIQMATSLAGLPIPNRIASKGLWSYNSLANEPSQLGRIVGISLLCYLMLDRLPKSLNTSEESSYLHWKVVAAFIITILLSGSALAILTIPMVFGLSRSSVWILLIIAISILIWPMFFLIDYEPIQRVILLISSLGSLDMNQVLKADHSGGIRLAPMLIYLNDASATEIGFWLGYGSSGLNDFFQNRIPGMGDKIGAPFLPGFAVVYGILVTALFIWVFAIRKSNRTTAPLIVFWAMFMSSSAWNTQTFWYGLIVIQIVWSASNSIGHYDNRTIRWKY